VKTDIHSLSAAKAGSITLDEAIFGIALADIRRDVLARMVRYQLAKRRAGTHKTQERGEVSRTGKRLGRQKGGGTARHGSRRSNIFVGGAVAHGPRVRDHGHELTKKFRRLALIHALSAKAAQNELIILDKAELGQAKTSELRKAFEALDLSNALIIGGASLDENFARAARNLTDIDVLPLAGINVYDVLRRKKLVLTKEAVEGLHVRLGGANAQGAAA
jgi:large subunit ribosomal protein L4